MILFHGSTMVIDRPRILITEHGRDFGPGFYVTEIKDQAVRWAKRKARLEKRKGRETKAVVSLYEFDEGNYTNLNVIRFPEPSAGWLDMVCACRSDMQYRHGYDMVIGKIANDNVGETVAFVVQGIMRKEDALERLKFEKINNQVCFASEKALSFLEFTGCEEF